MHLIRLRWIALACACSFASAIAQPAFDVASVKPSAPGQSLELTPLANGRFHASGITLRILIRAAYQVQDFQISGAPAWLDTERYDIDAKSSAPATSEQSRLMLQSLLTDRFKLKLRRESKETPALALVVANAAKNKLTAVDGTGCLPEPGPTNPCAGIRGSPREGIVIDRISMRLFAQFLTSMFQSRIIDKTGLDGVYNFKLDLAAAGFAPSVNPDMMEATAALTSALQEQLGLKLERTQSVNDVFAIEHVERPSAN